MTTALIVIDMQQGFDDPYWGPTTNRPGCEDNVARLVEAWQASGDPIVVVRHDSTGPASPLNPAHPGNALMEGIAAVDPALFVTKSVNSAFYGEPDLESWLREADIYPSLPALAAFHRRLGIDEARLLRAVRGACTLGQDFHNFSGGGSRFFHAYGPTGAPIRRG